MNRRSLSFSTAQASSSGASSVRPGQGLEDGGAQRVQRDEVGAPLADPEEAGAQQRLAAGEPDLVHAEFGDRDPDEPYDLVVREQVGTRR
ncbi:hypothetical protein ADL12_08170 [Streptomyces regalis]|uniref:Uncharacterized protein n=1 Tax=Streptomyces regalis TaxID=68262 RepID=A0A0X3VFH8_9ACTN|nr:hypothetical protein ADL12_08170 [Streptomyces regalis]